MFQKVRLEGEDGADIELYVIEQTRVNGISYLLVTQEADGDGEALILKDNSKDTDEESVYSFVEDDDELQAVGGVFATMLDDIDIK